MTLTNDRYINLFTDFGFKKLFGETPNKDLLIAFLNELLQGKEKIEDLSYLKNERLGNNEVERRAVYDLYCTNEKGEKIIIEIQRVKQEFFKDRSVYYSSFAVQDQAIKGRDWKYEMAAVYTIAIMDFVFDSKYNEKFEHRIKLMDEETGARQTSRFKNSNLYLIAQRALISIRKRKFVVHPKRPMRCSMKSSPICIWKFQNSPES